MATTDYVTGTVVTKDWLNDADAMIYEGNWPATVVPKTDTISEETTGAGVTIDGVQCKDSTVVMGSPFNFRNKIINGCFRFWQRGTSLTAATGLRFLADRWMTVGTGSTVAPSRQSISLGQTAVPGNPIYHHRAVVASSAGAGNYAQIVHRIEDVRTFSGQTAVLTFYAKADTNRPMSVEVSQVFGTGGSPSATINGDDVSWGGTGVAQFNIASSWQKFTMVINFPSISGKTLGTNDNSYIQLNFWLDAGSSWNSRTLSLGQQSGTFDLTRVQLEEGSVATPFEERSLGLELLLCYRYYERHPLCLSSTTAYPGGGTWTFKRNLNPAAGAQTVMIATDFKAVKRALPNMAARYDINDGTDTDVGAVSIITRGGFVIFVNSVASSSSVDLNDWYADAEL